MKLINDRLPKAKPYEIKRTPKAHDMEGFELYAQIQEESANAPIRAINNDNNNGNNDYPRGNYEIDYPRMIDMMLDMNMDDDLEDENAVALNQVNNLPVVEAAAQPNDDDDVNQPDIHNISDNIEYIDIVDSDGIAGSLDNDDVTTGDDYF